MLAKMDVQRIDKAIKFVELKAFDYVNSSYPDEVCTILALLYDYRRELTKQERKQNVVSQ